MRTFDFAPFYRSTVGFDRLFSMLDQVGGVESAAAPGYPPYNIKRSGENAYNISIAVAGFAGADLSIEVKENTLTIRGKKYLPLAAFDDPQWVVRQRPPQRRTCTSSLHGQVKYHFNQERHLVTRHARARHSADATERLCS